ncbi:MAG: hypothetical protein GY754_07915 [bacterium]|nr:hypothetical protein [bacterium]
MNYFVHFAPFLESLFASFDLSRFHLHTSHSNLCIFKDIKSVIDIPRAELRVIPENDPNLVCMEVIYYWEQGKIVRRISDRKILPITEALTEFKDFFQIFNILIENLGKHAIISFLD